MHALGISQRRRQLRGGASQRDAGAVVVAGAGDAADDICFHQQRAMRHAERQRLQVIGIGIGQDDGVAAGECKVTRGVFCRHLRQGWQGQHRGGGVDGDSDVLGPQTDRGGAVIGCNGKCRSAGKVLVGLKNHAVDGGGGIGRRGHKTDVARAVACQRRRIGRRGKRHDPIGCDDGDSLRVADIGVGNGDAGNGARIVLRCASAAAAVHNGGGCQHIGKAFGCHLAQHQRRFDAAGVRLQIPIPALVHRPGGIRRCRHLRPSQRRQLADHRRTLRARSYIAAIQQNVSISAQVRAPGLHRAGLGGQGGAVDRVSP